MNVEIGTESPIFLFLEYLFRNFPVLSLQCGAHCSGDKSISHNLPTMSQCGLTNSDFSHLCMNKIIFCHNLISKVDNSQGTENLELRCRFFEQL
jgi:hypothetical protein